MLKSIGTIQLALATIFVVPAVTGQDGESHSLDAQLDATLSSLEYLSGLRSSVEAGDGAAVRAIVVATESPRDASPQRATRLQGLRDDIARLRFTLDRLLADPSEVAAITSLPASVVRTLGLAGSTPTIPNRLDTTSTAGGNAASTTTPDRPAPWPGTEAGPSAPTSEQTTTMGPDLSTTGSGATGPITTGPITTGPMTTGAPTSPYAARPNVLAGTSPTTGLGASMRAAMQGELGPIDGVSEASRRRGDEPLAIEGDGYVADPVRLGKLLVRAGRSAEAIHVLERAPGSAATRYWLARAYQGQHRFDEALELYRALSDDQDAGDYGRFAKQDLDFLEFKRRFEQSSGVRRSR